MEVVENETFQLQAFEIKPPGEDFDPTKQPENGEEFLTHMLYERRQCPAVVAKRPKNLEQLSKPCDFTINEELSCADYVPDPSLVPTVEWKKFQSMNFNKTRSKITMKRQHFTHHNYDNSLDLPINKDKWAWLKFCQQHKPLLSTILRFNQRTLEKLLVRLRYWLKGDDDDEPPNGFLTLAAASTSKTAIKDLACSDQWLGDWLYAVLACLHLPIEPSVHGDLRIIARSCMYYRSLLKPHEYEKAIPYNLFIYLIGKEFDQLDLLEYV